jgi:protein-S-isoprenylcysteine O-methyltransferase Ste14
MGVVALVLVGVYFSVAFGLRTWLQYRRTRDSGFRGLSGRVGSAEWWGGILFIVAMAAALGGPVADLAGLNAVSAIDASWIHVIGIVLTLAGIIATFAAQVSMGNSWRVGVDANESTDLVTDGAFALVRNPIFTAMGLTGLGLVLVVPNVVSIAGLLTLLVALQMQVRGVEEPHLSHQHGARWDEYTARVGRFVPWLGTTGSLNRAGGRG